MERVANKNLAPACVTIANMSSSGNLPSTMDKVIEEVTIRIGSIKLTQRGNNSPSLSSKFSFRRRKYDTVVEGDPSANGDASLQVRVSVGRTNVLTEPKTRVPNISEPTYVFGGELKVPIDLSAFEQNLVLTPGFKHHVQPLNLQFFLQDIHEVPMATLQLPLASLSEVPKGKRWVSLKHMDGKSHTPAKIFFECWISKQSIVESNVVVLPLDSDASNTHNDNDHDHTQNKPSEDDNETEPDPADVTIVEETNASAQTTTTEPRETTTFQANAETNLIQLDSDNESITNLIQLDNDDNTSEPNTNTNTSTIANSTPTIIQTDSDTTLTNASDTNNTNNNNIDNDSNDNNNDDDDNNNNTSSNDNNSNTNNSVNDTIGTAPTNTITQENIADTSNNTNTTSTNNTTTTNTNNSNTNNDTSNTNNNDFVSLNQHMPLKKPDNDRAVEITNEHASLLQDSTSKKFKPTNVKPKRFHNSMWSSRKLSKSMNELDKLDDDESVVSTSPASSTSSSLQPSFSTGDTFVVSNLAESRGKSASRPHLDTSGSDSKSEIHVIYPEYGLVSGGTVVSIRGQNLASQLSDLTVLDCWGDCLRTATFVSPSLVKFVSLGVEGPQTVPVQLSNSSEAAKSTALFEFTTLLDASTDSSCMEFVFTEKQLRTPHVSRVTPHQGSHQGGTDIVIEGKNLGLDKYDVIDVIVAGVPYRTNTLKILGPNSLQVTTNAGVGTGAVTVITDVGGVGVCDFTARYSYEPEPTEMTVTTLVANVHDLENKTQEYEEKNKKLQMYSDKILAELLRLDETGKVLERLHDLRDTVVGTKV